MNALLIRAHNPGLYTGRGNNTYLIPGRSAVLIDAGVGETEHLDEIEQALAIHHCQSLSLVLVTHSHPDHASGAAALRRRWPKVQFAKAPWSERDTKYEVIWRALADGDCIETGEGSLRAIHTPGHAPDHLCFHHEASGTIFTGDLVVDNGTVMIPPIEGGGLVAYLASLERILALEPRLLLPAHGNPIDDGPAVLRKYLEHRKTREEQIVSSLSSTPKRVEEIAREVYKELSEALMPAACQTVTAHLLKLEGERRARSDGERWVSVKTSDK